jgi:5-methylthioadenosine/S-adenosylhomocysteine deaminase
VTPAVAPHAAYTLDRDTLLATRKLGLDYGVPVLIHLAETEDEVRQIEAAEGVGPTTYLDRIGFWGPRIVAAHAVWVRDAELPLLQRGRVGISHNPESNMKLASGVAPVPAYLAAGMATGLGTDGAASNNDLDMFEAMRQAAFLHKLSTKDPRVVSAPQALEMATLGGARVLGVEDRLGSLEVGKQADLIVVSTRRARQTPLYDPISTLVYASRGDDVETTIVAGRVLMERRVVQTLDEAQVLREAAAVAADVRAAVRPR